MNEVQIKALKWEGKDRRISLGDCLYLQLRQSSKTYLLIKRGKSKSSTTTLGKVTGSSGRSPEITLKKAKQIAASYNDTTAQQISTVTLAELVDKYWKEVGEPGYKQPKQALGYFTHIKDSLGHRKIKDVTRAELVSFIQHYAKRGARSADRLKSYLRVTFAYGVELGYIDQSPMVEVTKRVTGYSPNPRQRTLTNDEIKWLFADDHHHKRSLRFLLLTGLRVGELWGGYQDGDYWRVDDTKNGLPHWVYMTDSAKSCLPIKKVSSVRLQHWLRDQQDEDDKDKRWTPHDCRRTFATIANESGVLPHIVEKCLNHKLEGVMAVYNHAEYAAERIAAAQTVEQALLEVIRD